MRKKIKLRHVENMFGHSYYGDWADQTNVPVLENHCQAWHLNHTRVSKPFYWFRAPTINLEQLRTTLANLCDLSNPYELRMWHSDKGFDASLKITDDMDAAVWAWSHTEMWAKWSQEQEKEFLRSIKPVKLKVNADGTVKVKVTVSQLT